MIILRSVNLSLDNTIFMCNDFKSMPLKSTSDIESCNQNSPLVHTLFLSDRCCMLKYVAVFKECNCHASYVCSLTM